MKRILICAAAAIVALASCTKTQVVYNDAPEEIGFKAVTGVMTKGTLENTKDLGVFAHLYDNSNEGDEYFGNTQFTYNTDYWKAGKYWPVSNGLIFTVYSPYNSTKNAVNWNATNKTLSFPSGDNSTYNSQTDYLYGTTRPTGIADANAISVDLGHALAKITINVTATESDVVTLKTLTINKTRHNETCTVSYTDPNPIVSWTTTEDVTSKMATLISAETPLTSSATSVEYLVVPEAVVNQTISLTYKLKGSEKELTYTTKVKEGENPNQLGSTWSAGKNYVYNISIGPKEIKFNPSVTGWDANTDGNDGNDATAVNI